MRSPNFDARSEAPDTLVLHYTGMLSAAAALERLCDPRAAVSAHYLIDEAGRVHTLVDEDKRAWHAGVSFWRGRSGLNDCSIGIEIANTGHAHGLRPYPDAQISALLRLIDAIRARWPIADRDIVGHSDIAPLRKQDPGERFPWVRLARAGHGPWPAASGRAVSGDEEARRLLIEIGYGPHDIDTSFRTVVAAFQRRFRPLRVDGLVDSRTLGLAASLASIMRAE